MRHEDALDRLTELVGLHQAAIDDRELRAHLGECARCRARLAELRSIDARLRRLDAPPAPSQRLENRILAIPTGAGAPERARGGGWRRAAAAACVLLVVGVFVGAFMARDRSRPQSAFQSPRVVELVTAHPEVMTARIEIGAAAGGRIPIRLVATGLPRGRDRYYELWLSGGDGAVSAGSFRPDREGRCVVVLQVPVGEWTEVEVTSEGRPPSPHATMAGAPL